MAGKTILFAASLFAGATLVAAQAAPNWDYVSTQGAERHVFDLLV